MVSLLNLLLMVNIHNNGLDALSTAPLHILILLTGVTFFLIILIKGTRLLIKKEEIRKEIGWRQSDRIKYFLTLLFLIMNIVFVWALAL